LKKVLQENQTIDAYILQTVRSKNPETLEQLVKLVQEKFDYSDEEILRRILFLQSKGKMTLKKKEITATKFSNYLVSSRTYWYWATLIFTTATIVLSLKIPENAYPIVYIRYFFGSFFTLLLPGYTLVRALFPAKKLDNIEKIGLSIGMSIALVCLDAFFLNFTPWRITLISIIFTLSLLIMVFATIAFVHETYRTVHRES